MFIVVDVPAMEAALAELVTPKVRVNRQKELGFGLTEKPIFLCPLKIIQISGAKMRVYFHQSLLVRH